MLKAMFDGDKLAVSLILTDEANAEALRFLEDPQSMFTLSGYNYRKVLNKESISGLYGMTLEDPKAKEVPEELVKELVEAEDFEKLQDFVMDTYKDGKISSSKYKIGSPCTFEYKNKKIKTTLGRAFFNGAISNMLDLDYVNENMTGKVQKALLESADKQCLEALSKDDLVYFRERYIPFLNKWEKFVFVAADLFSPSSDMEFYATSPEYDKFKEKLIAENKEALDNGDLEVYDMVEKELTKKFKETNKADTAIFDSGSKLSLTGDARMGVIAVGPMPIGVGAGKYAISTSGLVDGTTKAERATYAQSNIISGYFRAMGPAVGGEQAKEILAASHDIKLDAKGSDCGRTVGQWYVIDDFFIKELDMRYMIKDKGAVEMLTKDSLKNKYFGKRIQVRSVHFCKNAKFCNICSGEKPYVIARGDTINIGAQTSIAGDEITQASLSKFHSNKTQFVNVDFNDFITPADFRFTESAVVTDEMVETFMNLQEFDRILIQEGNEELAEEIANDIEDVMDEIILNHPEEFNEYLNGAIDLDIHKLSKPEDEIYTELKDFCRKSGSIVQDIMKAFDKQLIIDLENFIVLSTVDHMGNFLSGYEHGLYRILSSAQSNANPSMPYLISVNDDPEYKYYKMFIPVFKMKSIDGAKLGLTPMDCRNKLEYAADSLNSYFLRKIEDTESPWVFNVDEDSEDNLYLTASPNFLILDTLLLKMQLDVNGYQHEEVYDENIEEAVILDAATKRKMDNKIKSTKNHLRTRYEGAINQAIQNASRQKKKAKDSIGETINHKATQLEHDMRSSKEDYKKHLSQMLQQFEADFIKRNNFKLLKLRNKLNFIYSKKSGNIDVAMNEAIKQLKHKMYSKSKEAESKIKDKYGVV